MVSSLFFISYHSGKRFIFIEPCKESAFGFNAFLIKKKTFFSISLICAMIFIIFIFYYYYFLFLLLGLICSSYTILLSWKLTSLIKDISFLILAFIYSTIWHFLLSTHLVSHKFWYILFYFHSLLNIFKVPFSSSLFGDV